MDRWWLVYPYAAKHTRTQPAANLETNKPSADTDLITVSARQ